MNIGYEPFFAIIIGSLLVYHFYRPVARKNEIRKAWKAIAKDMGWTYCDGLGRIVAIMEGLWQGRSFELKIFLTTARSEPLREFIDLSAAVETAYGFSFDTRLHEAIISDEADMWRKPFDRVKSGDVLFDNSYSFAGYPKEDVKRILANSEIRLAIKAIYPLNAAIFVHPMVHLVNGQIGIRLPKPLETKEAIQEYVEKLDKLAELIEKEIGGRL